MMQTRRIWGKPAKVSDPAILSAQYFYNLTIAPLSPSLELELKHLLQAHDDQSKPTDEEGRNECVQVFHVLPRGGTTSPWSSKAQSILETCDLPCERIVRGIRYAMKKLVDQELYYDRMTESVVSPSSIDHIVWQEKGKVDEQFDLADIAQVNQRLGLALDESEIEYLISGTKQAGKARMTPAELMMFAQVNSEHCRHKTFNARFVIDGKEKPSTLFGMIKNTHKASSKGTLSAYKDNAAVIQAPSPAKGQVAVRDGAYSWANVPTHTVLKVETHNHPTGVAPYPGAATGSGGEIRDEGSVGQGSRPKAGLSGFMTSHLMLPEFTHEWEIEQKAPHLASPLQIMLEAPLGAANYNNEFGRCALAGFFRTFSAKRPDGEGADGGYLKPMMLAGGIGTIRDSHIEKLPLQAGDKIAVLGGPGMLIGIGGGAASSVSHGTSSKDLDFASVQRENAEMERRCQGVIDACTCLHDGNPILSIHDVGAGGLSNAIPEIVEGTGCLVDLDKIPVADVGMTPMQIWCNESQERYVIATRKPEELEQICEREKCPMAIVGTVTSDNRLVVSKSSNEKVIVDLPMNFLLGHPPIHAKADKIVRPAFAGAAIHSYPPLEKAIKDVLSVPAVASKSFLITIGDRFIGGHTVQDQMVGKWQVPVADAAITLCSLDATREGEVVAMGERPIIALLNASASAGMALGEAITNLLSADVTDLSKVRCSANWMCAAKEEGQRSNLYEAVEALTKYCTELGISIPVGKDSLSMKASWTNSSETQKSVASPLSVVITALGHVMDVEKAQTPELRVVDEESVLLLVDLSHGTTRMGGSALLHTMGVVGSEKDYPKLEDTKLLAAFCKGMAHCREQELILAYHDRSDGGVVTSILEMCFASRMGVHINTVEIPFLFNEELGVLIQVASSNVARVTGCFTEAGLRSDSVTNVATVDPTFRKTGNRKDLRIRIGSDYDQDVLGLYQLWSRTSYEISKIRDLAQAAQSEYALCADANDTGLFMELTYQVPTSLPEHGPVESRPKVGVLREPGVNGHYDMACSFMRAGFEVQDITSSDLCSSPDMLSSLRGLAFPGGFSYGDVLGAGRGWAANLKKHLSARTLRSFIDRGDTFILGICNGCQALAEIFGWQPFVLNESGRFESRVVMVEVTDDKTMFFKGMKGSKMPVCLAHAEGRLAEAPEYPALQYIGQRYPQNPSGTARGIAGCRDASGRVLLMMPHPERMVHAANMQAYLRHNYAPNNEDSGCSPWMKMFINARDFCRD